MAVSRHANVTDGLTLRDAEGVNIIFPALDGTEEHWGRVELGDLARSIQTNESTITVALLAWLEHALITAGYDTEEDFDGLTMNDIWTTFFTDIGFYNHDEGAEPVPPPAWVRHNKVRGVLTRMHARVNIGMQPPNDNQPNAANNNNGFNMQDFADVLKESLQGNNMNNSAFDRLMAQQALAGGGNSGTGPDMADIFEAMQAESFDLQQALTDANLATISESAAPPRKMVQLLNLAKSGGTTKFFSPFPNVDFKQSKYRVIGSDPLQLNHTNNKFNFAQWLRHINALLVSHLIVNNIDLATFVNYQDVILKVASEKNGVTAVEYHNRLMISLERKCENAGNISSVPEALSEICAEKLRDSEYEMNWSRDNKKNSWERSPGKSKSESSESSGREKYQKTDDKKVSLKEYGKNRPCRNYQTGDCKRGDDCYFQHVCSECNREKCWKGKKGCPGSSDRS